MVRIDTDVLKFYFSHTDSIEAKDNPQRLPAAHCGLQK